MIKKATILAGLILLFQTFCFSQTADLTVETIETELIFPAQVLSSDGKTLKLAIICEKDYRPDEKTPLTIHMYQVISNAKKPTQLNYKKISAAVSKIENAESDLVINLTAHVHAEDKDLNKFLESEEYIHVAWKKDLLLEHEVVKDAQGIIVNENFYSDGLSMGQSISYNATDSMKVVCGNVLGEYHGKYDIYYNGTLFKEYNYFVGELSGEEIWYHENGSKKYVGNCIDGLREGKVTKYYDNGKVHVTGYYERDTLEGKYYCYHENGNKKVSGEKHKGEFHGMATSYYENGKIHFQQEKVIGVNTGSYLRNYESGKLEVEANWKDNLLHGERIDYYENGKKKMKGNYEAGKQIGTWLYWDEEGVKTEKKF